LISEVDRREEEILVASLAVDHKYDGHSDDDEGAGQRSVHPLNSERGRRDGGQV
jgi:hypothetical protein